MDTCVHVRAVTTCVNCVQIPFPAGEDRCRWFARSLLEGAVLKELRKCKLAFHPSIITLKAPQRRCAVLVGALASPTPQIDCKRALKEKLQREPGYLKDAFMMWIQKGSEVEAAQQWTKAVTSLCKEA